MHACNVYHAHGYFKFYNQQLHIHTHLHNTYTCTCAHSGVPRQKRDVEDFAGDQREADQRLAQVRDLFVCMVLVLVCLCHGVYICRCMYICVYVRKQIRIMHIRMCVCVRVRMFACKHA